MTYKKGMDVKTELIRLQAVSPQPWFMFVISEGVGLSEKNSLPLWERKSTRASMASCQGLGKQPLPQLQPLPAAQRAVHGQEERL